MAFWNRKKPTLHDGVPDTMPVTSWYIQTEGYSSGGHDTATESKHGVNVYKYHKWSREQLAKERFPQYLAKLTPWGQEFYLKLGHGWDGTGNGWPLIEWDPGNPQEAWKGWWFLWSGQPGSRDVWSTQQEPRLVLVTRGRYKLVSYQQLGEEVDLHDPRRQVRPGFQLRRMTPDEIAREEALMAPPPPKPASPPSVQQVAPPPPPVVATPPSPVVVEPVAVPPSSPPVEPPLPPVDPDEVAPRVPGRVTLPIAAPRFPGRTAAEFMELMHTYHKPQPAAFVRSVERILRELAERAPHRYREALEYLPHALIDDEMLKQTSRHWTPTVTANSAGWFASRNLSRKYEDFRLTFIHEVGHNVVDHFTLFQPPGLDHPFSTFPANDPWGMEWQAEEYAAQVFEDMGISDRWTRHDRQRYPHKRSDSLFAAEGAIYDECGGVAITRQNG